MRLILSCACCGSTDFNPIINTTCVFDEDSCLVPKRGGEIEEVACSICGSRDYIRKLGVTFAKF